MPTLAERAATEKAGNDESERKELISYLADLADDLNSAFARLNELEMRYEALAGFVNMPCNLQWQP